MINFTFSQVCPKLVGYNLERQLSPFELSVFQKVCACVIQKKGKVFYLILFKGKWAKFTNFIPFQSFESTHLMPNWYGHMAPCALVCLIGK